AQTARVTRLPAAALALALLLAGCGSGDDPTVAAPSPSSSPSPSPTPSVTPSPVPVEPAPVAAPQWEGCEGAFECATLTVPLVEGEPATVDLALTRLRTAAAEGRIGSLVVNPGGPGASAVDYLQRGWQLVPERVRARFDLVAFDPRGVGRSSQVRCGTTAELDAYFAVDPAPDDATELRALEDANAAFVRGCAAQAGGLLPHVSTEQAALDLERVRAAIGDERLTYLGYSYGTSLGAAYLDAFPTRVRAMVLDGGIDPELTWEGLLEGQSTGFDRALEEFLADCDVFDCAYRSAVEGDLLQAYDRLAARVETSLLPTGQARVVGPAELSLGVGAGLYSRSSGWPALAAALAAAERGDGGPLLALNDQYLGRGPDGYEGTTEALSAVVCLDRQWPRETAPYVALAERVRATAPRFGPSIALSGLVCAGWPVPPVGGPQRVTAPGSPPVLVVGTTRDPATPYAWSVALAEQLSGGVLLTYDGDGHTVYRTGGPGCVREVVDAYLLEADEPPVTIC
ncbi:MAG: alpha/beta hydrolase, partial [Frankiaceae bacterium]|nr:alpha/beta hydrolase [Frankiaceae bacterium]